MVSHFRKSYQNDKKHCHLIDFAEKSMITLPAQDTLTNKHIYNISIRKYVVTYMFSNIDEGGSNSERQCRVKGLQY